VFFVIANGKQPTMDKRMKGLDPAVHDFGKAGHLRNVDNLYPRLAKRAGGATGGKQLNSPFTQGSGKLFNTGLIRQAELFSVNTDAGGIGLNFGGANEDGVEELPITFTGSLDTTRTDGYQLLSYIEDVGAM
jgi:hypothetical protein